MVTPPQSSSERMMKPEYIIIGEAVELEVSAASLGQRMLSAILDYGLLLLGMVMSFTLGLALFAETLSSLSFAVAAALGSVFLLTWSVLVPVTVEVLSRGRSAGRLVTGTRVVRDDGGTIHLRHALVRAMVGFVEIWLTAGIPATLASIVTRRGKRLGDLMAGTYVVHDRRSHQSAPPLLMPPELSTWARSAQMRPLPGHLALVARTFLQRASSMRPEARRRLALQLAAELEPFVTAPPEGTHPERFLAAVLTARRDRELMLELRDRRWDESRREQLEHLPYEISSEHHR